MARCRRARACGAWRDVGREAKGVSRFFVFQTKAKRGDSPGNPTSDVFSFFVFLCFFPFLQDILRKHEV